MVPSSCFRRWECWSVSSGQRRGLGNRLEASGGDIDLRQRIRVVLIFRLGLEDHAVLVRLPVDGRNLALTEGIAQGIDDALHGDSKPAGSVAIDLHVQAETV